MAHLVLRGFASHAFLKGPLHMDPVYRACPVSEFLYLITKYFVKFTMCSNVERAGWLGYREISFFLSRVSVNGLPYEHFSLFTWTKVG